MVRGAAFASYLPDLAEVTNPGRPSCDPAPPVSQLVNSQPVQRSFKIGDGDRVIRGPHTIAPPGLAHRLFEVRGS